MNNFFRAIIAGYGAKKLGGGCFGTIIVFIIIWVALGQCSFSSREAPPPETFPADRRASISEPLPYAIAMISERDPKAELEDLCTLLTASETAASAVLPPG